MAKGKNATALFEVIGKSKGLKPDAPKGGLATPRWWFRSGKSASAAATPAASQAPGSATAPSMAGHASSAATHALAPTAHPPVVTPPAPAPDRTAAPAAAERAPAAAERAPAAAERAPAAPERTRLGPMTALPKDPASPVSDSARGATAHPTATAVHPAAAAQPRANLSVAGPHAGSPVYLGRSDASDPAERVHVDPERQEIHLRLTYTAAIVLAVAMLVGVAVAVLIGRSWGQGWPGLSQPGTADLLTGPARPDVLQPAAQQGKLDFIDNDPAGLSAVGTPPRTPQTAEGGMATRGGPAAEPRSGVDARPASDVAAPARGSATAQPGAAATPPGTATGRVVGINYFIVQSYPDERDARAVVDLLARHGIPTTIERNLPGYPRWHIVVTTQGFTSLRSPEAEALRRRIDQISADQARLDRRWKPLTPQGYRWR